MVPSSCRQPILCGTVRGLGAGADAGASVSWPSTFDLRTDPGACAGVADIVTRGTLSVCLRGR